MSLDPPPQTPSHHDPSRPPRKNDPPARPPPPNVPAPGSAPADTNSSAPTAAAAAPPNPYGGKINDFVIIAVIRYT